MTSVEKRRFTRVQVPRALADKLPAFRAQITWPNLEMSDILDLSYKGMAVRRPGLFKLENQAEIVISAELGNLKSFRVPVRIIWSTLSSVGLDIRELGPDGHLAMHDYLDAKLVAAQLRAVQREFVALDETFEFWYQTAGVHVFIWMSHPGQVSRVAVQMGEELTQMVRGRPVRLETSRERQALLLLSQMDRPEHPMEEFVRSLQLGV